MATKKGGYSMKNIESLFDFYIRNRMHTTSNEIANKVFATMIAVNNYTNCEEYNLSKIVKMIILDGSNTNKIVNKGKIKAILEELYQGETNESQEVKKCLEMAEKLQSDGIEDDLEQIYGALLLSTGIDIECGLKLDFNKLYEKIVRITTFELEKEKNTRLKYCYHNIYNVTEEYSYLILFLEKIISLKLKEQKEFNEAYEEQKRFYRSMPILSGILEKTKKL